TCALPIYWERKDDSDAPPERVQVAPRTHAFSANLDVAAKAHARCELVHAVQHAQERCFPAIGRTDDAEDLVLVNRQVDVREHRFSGVLDAEILDANLDFGGRIRFHHFFFPRRYILNAIDAAFMVSTIPINTRATP